jgi:hypothetical protein
MHVRLLHVTRVMVAFGAATLTRFPCTGDVEDASASAYRACFDIRRDTAWNLICLLRSSGSHRMARDLRDRYLSLD